MWDFLRGIQDQVTKYSTWLGQLWYLCVFVFRLIVVVTIAEAVYGGELDEFSCSTNEPGCTLMCFNEFNQMSHIRFWSFQLLAVATPTMIFHLASSAVTGQIQKVEEEEASLKKLLDDNQSEYTLAPSDPSEETQEQKKRHKLEKRKKRVGNVKMKKVYTEKGMQQVAYTNMIHIAYFISVILRLVAEGVFIYLGYQLFSIMDQSAKEEYGSASLYFLLFRVPAMYKCAGGKSAGVEKACSQTVSIGGAVPCWVSRPWEKSILISYMNILSGICFLLSCLELVYLLIKAGIAYQKQNTKRMMTAQQTNILRAAPIYGAPYHPMTRPIFDRQPYPTTIRQPYEQSRYIAAPTEQSRYIAAPTEQSRYIAAPTSAAGGYNPGYVREGYA